MPHTLIIDGLQVPNVSDEAKAAIEKLQGQVKDADGRAAKAEGDIAKLTTDKATLDAKVTTLEQQVKDAKLTPQQLRDAAKVYGQTIDTAKKLVPNIQIGDDADELAVKRAVVAAKLGDAAKDWTDEQVAVSFSTLAASVPVADAKPDPLRIAIASQPVSVADAEAEYDAARAKHVNDLSSAWQKPAAANAA